MDTPHPEAPQRGLIESRVLLLEFFEAQNRTRLTGGIKALVHKQTPAMEPLPS
jgi:hypothetical protein